MRRFLLLSCVCTMCIHTGIFDTIKTGNEHAVLREVQNNPKLLYTQDQNGRSIDDVAIAHKRYDVYTAIQMYRACTTYRYYQGTCSKTPKKRTSTDASLDDRSECEQDELASPLAPTKPGPSPDDIFTTGQHNQDEHGE